MRRSSSSPASPWASSARTEDAPRVLIANSNLVPHWATQEHFDELCAKGLMMFGQMTAGSLDLHRHAGHSPGHLRDLRRRCARSHRTSTGHPRGQARASRPGAEWHGRRPAARRHAQRRHLPHRVDVDHSPSSSVGPRPLPRRDRPPTIDEAIDARVSTRLVASNTRCRSASDCNCGRVAPELMRARYHPRRRSPTRPAPTTRWTDTSRRHRLLCDAAEAPPRR